MEPSEPRRTGSLDRLREMAEPIAQAVRRASRWQRLRAAILGGWILASLLALWIACPSSGPANSIRADVRILDDSLLGGQQILVRNESHETWTDVILTLDDTWRYAQRTLRPKEQVVLSPSQFSRDGEPAPRELRPVRLSVRCGQGSARVKLR